MDLVTFNFVVAWASSAVGIVLLLLAVGYKELMAYIRDPYTHVFPCFVLFFWACSLCFESLGEEESQFIEMFVFSIVTIPLYHSYLQMEFPDETPDFFYYFMGGGTLISVGCVLFYEIKKYVGEIYGLSIEMPQFVAVYLIEITPDSRNIMALSFLAVVPIFIYYLVRYAPDRASKQREEEAKEKERALTLQRSSQWMPAKSSRGGGLGSSSRQNRWLPSNDDDINSVDGGPPSEAYDDASDDDG